MNGGNGNEERNEYIYIVDRHSRHRHRDNNDINCRYYILLDYDVDYYDDYYEYIVDCIFEDKDYCQLEEHNEHDLLVDIELEPYLH